MGLVEDEDGDREEWKFNFSGSFSGDLETLSGNISLL